MPKTTTPSTPIRELKSLTRLIQKAPGFPGVLAALKNGHVLPRLTAPGDRPARSSRRHWRFMLLRRLSSSWRMSAMSTTFATT